MHHYEVRNYRTGTDAFEYVNEHSTEVPDIWTTEGYFGYPARNATPPKKYRTRADAKVVCEVLANAREAEYMKHYTEYKGMRKPKPKWMVYKMG